MKIFVVIAIAAAFATGLSIWFFNLASFFSGSSSQSRRRLNVSLVAVALAVAGVAALLSGVVVVGLAAGFVAYFAPSFYAESKERKSRLDRMEAVAAFCQALADSVGGGSSMMAAVQSACQNPPKAIEAQVRLLRTRLTSSPFEDAIERFVIELDTPAADLMGAHLVQASRSASGRLSQVLRRISESLNEFILTSKKIATSRRRQEFEIRGLSLVLLTVMLIMLLTGSDLLEVYNRGLMGELKLGLVFGLSLAGWLVAHKLSGLVDQTNFRMRVGDK